MTEALEKKFNSELEKLKAVQADKTKCMQATQKLESQLQENKFVQEEMELLGDEAVIYRLEGPVMIKQDSVESLQNVAKRIEYITSELKRYDQQIKELDKQREAYQESLGKIQQQFQQAQVKAAARA